MGDFLKDKLLHSLCSVPQKEMLLVSTPVLLPFCVSIIIFFHICMVIFSAPIGQGYGLTETCAGGTFSDVDDTSVGRVGPPLPCSFIKVIMD